MKRLLLLSTVLMALVALPGLASANHFTGELIIADCEGFDAQLDIHFGPNYDSLELHYEVAVLDADGNEIEVLMGDLTVYPDDDLDVTILVSDSFTTVLEGDFVVSGTITISPYPDGSTSFEIPISCGSVATDEVSFDDVKAMYR